jgi:hypothetical protein
VTQEVVTTPDLVLTVYDPNAKYIDWEGPTCLRIYGVERRELWGGSCGAVTVTLRHKTNLWICRTAVVSSGGRMYQGFTWLDSS